MNEYIIESIKDSIHVKTLLLNNQDNVLQIENISNLLINTFKNKNKVLFCGNGGSAADAQHLSAELSGRFKFDRKPLDAEALHVNTSYITAVANDYSYDEIFSRLVEAKGNSGDVLIGLSTSGNSKNVVKAFEIAKKINMITVALTGNSNNKLEQIADYCIKVPSNDTAKIQESHIMVGHIICDLTEQGIFNDFRN
jgi:D-sedoheptulose 7-phosphate isomerase